jgi:hypothetical protein
MPDDHAAFLAYMEKHGALTDELRQKYPPRPNDDDCAGAADAVLIHRDARCH